MRTTQLTKSLCRTNSSFKCVKISKPILFKPIKPIYFGQKNNVRFIQFPVHSQNTILTSYSKSDNMTFENVEKMENEKEKQEIKKEMENENAEKIENIAQVEIMPATWGDRIKMTLNEWFPSLYATLTTCLIKPTSQWGAGWIYYVKAVAITFAGVILYIGSTFALLIVIGTGFVCLFIVFGHLYDAIQGPSAPPTSEKNRTSKPDKNHLIKNLRHVKIKNVGHSWSIIRY